MGFEYVSDLPCGYEGMVLAAGRVGDAVGGRGRSRARRDFQECFRRGKSWADADPLPPQRRLSIDDPVSGPS